MKKPAHTKLQGHGAASPILQLFLLLLLLFGLTGIQSARAQSFALSNLWSMAPAYDAFLNTTDQQYARPGLQPGDGPSAGGEPHRRSNAVHVLDGGDRRRIGTLPFDTNVIKGGTFVINMIGVTDDGVIYVGNLTTDATNRQPTGPFKLYRWANESAQPTLAYSGDPSSPNTVGTSAQRRFGDSLALRGTGTGTQILLGTYNQVVGLLTTTDGMNFTATKITTDAACGGDPPRVWPGVRANTFWAKHSRRQSKAVQPEPGHTDRLQYHHHRHVSRLCAEGLDVDVSRNLVAIVCTNHTLQLYDIINPAAPVQQDTTRTFPTPARANGNWVGCAALRSGKLFGLDVNNGILAYSLHEVYLPPIIKTQPANVTIWEGAAWWTFTVVATGNRGEPLSYQWQFGGTNIAGATASSLTISNIAIANEGYYSVVVTNAIGTATSSSALMTVVSSAASATK